MALSLFNYIPSKAPYIPNDEMAEIWVHGFTKTQKLDNRIDNIGAYLSAHISDMEIEEADSLGIEYDIEDIKEIKEIKKIDNQQLENSKYYIKGARLSLYPPKFNLYRTSKGIKKPVKEYKAIINKKDVFTYIGERTEFEVVLDYRKLKNIEII